MTPAEYIANHSYELSARIDQYLASLKRITSGIGMDLKLQESWVSPSLMSYNIEMIVNGSFVSGGIKKIGSERPSNHPSKQGRLYLYFSTSYRIEIF